MIRFSLFIRAAAPLLTALMILSASAPLYAFLQPSLSISSGSTTGSYYAASSAIAKIFNRRSVEYGVRLVAVTSQGSIANIESVADGKAAFGIANTEVLQRAAKGVGPWEWKARKELRAVLGLYLETVTIVAASDRGINRMSDLKGKRLNIGAPDSVNYAYASDLLQLSGLKPADVILSDHPAPLAPESLQKGDIDAYIYTVGHPNLSVLEASMGKRKVLLVPLDKVVIEQVTKKNPLLLPAVVPTNFYPALKSREVVPTVGVRAVLFTRADMPEETVYRLVRDIMTNFDLFRRQHPVLQNLTPRDAAGVTVIPLHPGAGRYFSEAGLLDSRSSR